MTGMELKAAWDSEPWMCGVFEMPVPDNRSFGEIHYPYQMLVFEKEDKRPIAQFALEISAAGTFWGASFPNGNHYNYGPESENVDLETFVSRAKSWLEDHRSRLK